MKKLFFLFRIMFQKKQQENRMVEKWCIIFSLFSLILFYSQTSNAQAPDWLWAKSAGGTGNENSNSVSADANGNVYVTGDFESPSLTFGTTTLNNINSNGGSDIFIAKYDNVGNILWAKSAGGNYDDKAISVTTDGSNNVLITGYFQSSSIVFGTITLYNNIVMVLMIFI